MTDAYNYCCTQLRAALDESPGGEKAWVPLRRSLVQACIDNLILAGDAVALMGELRALLDRALITPDALAQAEAVRVDDIWASLSRAERVEEIRKARETGDCPAYLPAKRTWMRHYPEAFARPNGGTHE